MAWLFNGVSDSLAAALVLPTDKLTVSLWIKRSSTAEGVLFDTHASTSVYDRNIQIDASGYAITRIWSNPGNLFTQSAVQVPVGEWVHVLYRHGVNAGGQRLVVQGVAAVSAGQTQSYFTWQSHVRAATGNYILPSGATSGLKPFSGAMAEFAIWSDELTVAEENALALGASPLALTNRIGSLLLYQDLIRPIDRPGVGVGMTVVGSPAVTAHPAGHSPRGFSGGWGGFPRSPLPYHAAAGGFSAAGLTVGQATVAGSDSAQVAMTQEV